MDAVQLALSKLRILQFSLKIRCLRLSDWTEWSWLSLINSLRSFAHFQITIWVRVVCKFTYVFSTDLQCSYLYPATQEPNFAQNLYGKSTTTDILLKSDLHVRMLRNRLTPNLLSFAQSTREEIEFALQVEFPLDGGDIPRFCHLIWFWLTKMA